MIEESKRIHSVHRCGKRWTDFIRSVSPRLCRGSRNYSDGPEALTAEPLAAECTIDDFTKVDLRVARILTAEEVPDARKLLKLTLSLGGDVRKTVFAGIKKPIRSRRSWSAAWSFASPTCSRGK